MQGDRNSFDNALNSLNTTVSSLDNFKGKGGALEWLHKNVHPLAVKYDFEITVNIFQDGLRWRLGSLGTIYEAHYFDYRSSKSPGRGWTWRANWHSHADGNSSGFSGQDRRLYSSINKHYPNISFHVSFIET